MPRHIPLVLLHGFDGSPSTFGRWIKRLRWLGHEAVVPLHYRTDADELDLVDLARAFDVVIQHVPSLNKGGRFDVMAHSTGALIARAWMAGDPARRARVRRFVALAPATFGSPWAHVGRGMLAAGFLGSVEPGPDFLESGDALLRDLELGSQGLWHLSDADLGGDDDWTRDGDGVGPDTWTFVGSRGYPFPLSIAHPPASDGVVRHAGVGLHASTIVVDARCNALRAGAPRIRVWSPRARPPVTLASLHHGSIASRPPASLAAWVASFLRAEGAEELDRVAATARRMHAPADDPYVQLLVRVQDDAARPVVDWYLDLLVEDRADRQGRPGSSRAWRSVLDARRPGSKRADVHVVRGDRSIRVFHVPWANFDDTRSLGLRLVARTGTNTLTYVGWHGSFLSSGRRRQDGGHGDVRRDVTPEASLHDASVLDLGHVQRGPDGLRPGRTTRLSIVIDRAAVPVGGPLPWFRPVDL